MSNFDAHDEGPSQSSESTIVEDEKHLLQTILTVHKQNDEPNIEIEDWFNCLENAVKKSYSDIFCSKTRNGTLRPLTQLSILLRECMLSHRWSEAVTVWSALLQLPTTSRQAVYRVGAEILYNAQDGNQEAAEQFFNQVKRLRDVGGRYEVVLEHAMYLLMIGRINDASNCIKDLPPKLGGRYKKGTDHEANSQRVYLGYVGITHYFKYCMLKAGIQRREISDEDETSKSQHETMMELSTSAIECLKSSLGDDLSGQWDIFVSTYVELLEFQKRHEEALKVLEKYAEQNPENPNALRYLILFHQRHKDNQNQLKYMKQFCDTIPSDKMVLNLHQRLKCEDCPAAESLPLLFDLLDYGDWASKVKPWTSLAEQLESIIKNDDPEDTSCVTECWEERKSWWPSYHFTSTPGGKPSREDHAVAIHKARVAAVVLDPDCPYVQDVLARGIRSEDLKPLRKCIKRLKKRRNKER